MIPNRKLKRVHHAVMFRTIARSLSQRALCRDGLVKELDVSITTVLKWIQLLHTRSPGQFDNLIYVAYWRKPLHPGFPIAYFAWGYGRDDAERPKRLSASETCRRYRRKKARMAESAGVVHA